MILLLSSSLYSNSKKNWINEIATSVDVDSFVKSIKFETQLRTCKIDDIHDSLIGVELHHMDLFMFTETVREKGYVMFMQTNILDSASSDDSLGGIGKILGMGNNRKKKGKQYINMVQIPIFGLLTESLGLDGIACFHPKSKFFFYSSAIDPTSVDYIQYMVLIDTMSLFNINGIMSMIIDCVAYEGYNALGDKNSEAAKYFENVIDTYQHSLGCTGGISLGASNQSKSPLVNGMVTSASLLKIMSRTGVVLMQSKTSLLNKGRDVTCSQFSGPFIKSQYVPQMILPISSKMFELGSTPAQWAEFKDDQSTQGDTAIAWWVRKDFVAYSGTCVW